MSAADDIAYLRSISQATMMTVSVHRLRMIADRLEKMGGALQDVLDDDAGHASGYEPISDEVLQRLRDLIYG